MAGKAEPLVCVLTPVYNGEKLIAGCIRSVLEQTYTNFQYIIVNNCSTDRTLEIAQAFAQQDSRIRVHDNTEFLNVVDNHNKAFSLIPAEAKYSKNVDADDWIFPTCLAELVKVAEEHPTTGMVTSYVLNGKHVGWDGLPYPSTFMKGSEVCRLRFLKGLKVFGGPSASLLRASVVKEQSRSTSWTTITVTPKPTSTCCRNMTSGLFTRCFRSIAKAETTRAPPASCKE